MTQITINDGTTTITMPKVKAIKVGGETLSKDIEMASGKIVSEIIGIRIVLAVSWDYVPASTMVSLMTMLRAGGFFTVGYPDPDGTDYSKKFLIPMPNPGIFKFVDGVPMWHGVSLNMTAQEVI